MILGVCIAVLAVLLFAAVFMRPHQPRFYTRGNPPGSGTSSTRRRRNRRVYGGSRKGPLRGALNSTKLWLRAREIGRVESL